MSSLAAGRAQMELSLGFHMIFAAIGVAMPVLMLIAEWRWIRHQDADALRLARVWAKVTAVTFAVGAVSGTALSFELGLLWPGFMRIAGPVIGPAFALEGYAFFIEAIFLGLYLYGWDRLTPRQHWWCGVAVAVSGALSAILVLAANAWMQNPAGTDAWGVLANPAWPAMALHSTLSAYQAVGFAVAGAYAWTLLRGGSSNRYALVGDRLAKRAHAHQPAKLAAMEGQFVTERHAPLRIGGWPDPDRRVTPYAIEIPGALSFLAANDVQTEVAGLDQFSRDDWPNVRLMHVAFQVMVGSGMLMLMAGVWYWGGRLLRRGATRVPSRWLLRLLVLCAPLGFLALEAGWVVTEAGRQPWVIYHVLRTRDAVTPVANVSGSLAMFAVIYTGLLVILVTFLRGLRRRVDA